MKIVWIAWTIISIISVIVLYRWWFPKKGKDESLDWRAGFFDLFDKLMANEKELREARQQRDEWQEKYEKLRAHLKEGQKI